MNADGTFVSSEIRAIYLRRARRYAFTLRTTYVAVGEKAEAPG